jgi:hypothetical protein
MTIKEGDPIKYESFNGDVYDGVLKKVRSERHVDIEVAIPGVKEPWPMKAVEAARVKAATT